MRVSRRAAPTGTPGTARAAVDPVGGGRSRRAGQLAIPRGSWPHQPDLPAPRASGNAGPASAAASRSAGRRGAPRMPLPGLSPRRAARPVRSAWRDRRGQSSCWRPQCDPRRRAGGTAGDPKYTAHPPAAPTIQSRRREAGPGSRPGGRHAAARGYPPAAAGSCAAGRGRRSRHGPRRAARGRRAPASQYAPGRANSRAADPSSRQPRPPDPDIPRVDRQAAIGKGQAGVQRRGGDLQRLERVRIRVIQEGVPAAV